MCMTDFEIAKIVNIIVKNTVAKIQKALLASKIE